MKGYGIQTRSGELMFHRNSRGKNMLNNEFMTILSECY